MDHPYSFPSPQPYHEFMHLPSISGSDSLGTSSLAGFNTNLHHAAHSFPSSPISPVHNSQGQQQAQFSIQQRNGSTMKLGGDSVTSEDDDALGTSHRKAQRKAQNRAAQQAFRKRKEMHVKDLETKLASLEAAQQQVLVENQHLKQDLHKMSTENEILRATSQISGEDVAASSLEPATFNAARFYANFLPNPNSKTTRSVYHSSNGERLMDAGAAWDFIIGHRLFKKGLVDVGDVSERLKHSARYENHRLVLSERDIVAAIEQSVASRTDDLL